MMFRKLDGLGFGIEGHDATHGHFDLSSNGRASSSQSPNPCEPFGRSVNFFKFQIIGATFACSSRERNGACCTLVAGPLLQTASLAASGLIRISCAPDNQGRTSYASIL